MALLFAQSLNLCAAMPYRGLVALGVHLRMDGAAQAHGTSLPKCIRYTLTHVAVVLVERSEDSAGVPWPLKAAVALVRCISLMTTVACCRLRQKTDACT